MCPEKIQIRLRVCAEWSESSHLRVQSFFMRTIKTDQTARMQLLIWVFMGAHRRYIFSHCDPCTYLGVCVNFTCETVAAECVLNEQGEANCECPTIDENDDNPVCGYVVWELGGTPKDTWKSERHLRNYACSNNATDYILLHQGPCGGNRATPYAKRGHGAKTKEWGN